MKIALDMQSRQTIGSRDRGIGRYSLSLAKAMLEVGDRHEFVIVANAALGAVEQVREDFGLASRAKELKVFSSLTSTRAGDPRNMWRRRASELIRENFLSELGVDFVHATSLFEGFGCDAVSSISNRRNRYLEAVTLYDLIPYAYADIYLQDPAIKAWYFEKIGHLRRADLLLAISDFSARDAVSRLGLFANDVVNISGAADPHFAPAVLDEERRSALKHRYGLSRFIMYTGGIDHRKNIEGLIASYALLPSSLKESHQLAIVCKVHTAERQKLAALVKSCGLAADRVILTGFVPEDDLVDMYNACDLFVFPSWCEGFGLPALEAMQCGAPVIAANCSSLPEVVGRADALFDPRDNQDMAASMVAVLENEGFQRDLREHGLRQASRFTWRSSAITALEAMEESQQRHRASQQEACSMVAVPDWRPRLAFISPLPSERSGIAVHAAELLPFLSRYYRITLVNPSGVTDDAYLHANMTVRSVNWFRANSEQFDRVVYQFGNSSFHSHMFDLLQEIPGVVVLHDFWLSGAVSYADIAEDRPGFWNSELQFSHGWGALEERSRLGDEHARREFPTNRRVVETAAGVIVHSRKALDLLGKWCGSASRDAAACIQLLRVVPAERNKVDALRKLGYPSTSRLVCSFGFIDATKHSLAIVDAFLESSLATDPHARLVLVGANPATEYGEAIQERATRSNGRVSFTGFVEQDEYELYLAAAEAAVQLREGGRGETSRAALDCLAHGAALLINDNAAFSEIPGPAVYKLPANFDRGQLKTALQSVMTASSSRAEQIEAGIDYLRRSCDPADVARSYYNSIEGFQVSSERLSTARTCRDLLKVDSEVMPSRQDLALAAMAIRRNARLKASTPALYVDAALGGLIDKQQLLAAERLNNAEVMSIEFVDYGGVDFYIARRQMLALLGLADDLLPDVDVSVLSGSVFLLDLTSLRERIGHSSVAVELFSRFEPSVDRVWFHCSHEWMQEPSMELLQSAARVAEGFLVQNEGDAEQLAIWLGLTLGAIGRIEVRVCWSSVDEDDSLLQFFLSRATGEKCDQQRLVRAHEGRLWFAGNPVLGSQVGRLSGGLLRSNGEAGFLVFGPYAELQVGRYLLQIHGRADAGRHDESWYDVVASRGQRRIAESASLDGVTQGLLAEQEIVLNSPVDDVEIRIWVGEGEEVDFLAICLSAV